MNETDISLSAIGRYHTQNRRANHNFNLPALLVTTNNGTNRKRHKMR